MRIGIEGEGGFFSTVKCTDDAGEGDWGGWQKPAELLVFCKHCADSLCKHCIRCANIVFVVQTLYSLCKHCIRCANIVFVVQTLCSLCKHCVDSSTAVVYLQLPKSCIDINLAFLYIWGGGSRTMRQQVRRNKSLSSARRWLPAAGACLPYGNPSHFMYLPNNSESTGCLL